MSILQWTAEALNIINECCERIGMADVAENIIVIFCDNKRTTMGTAWTHFGPDRSYPKDHELQPLTGKPRGGVIKFCVKLYQRADEDKRTENIIHELAHILANLQEGKGVGHRKPWKEMMVRLGEPYGVHVAKRCHNVSTKGIKRKQRRYVMWCPDRCGWKMTLTSSRRTRRMNALREMRVSLACPWCKASIGLKDYENAAQLEE